MKCIVTGGNGFIGSHLVDALVNQGNEVHVIDDLSAFNDKFYYNPEAKNHEVDIRNLDDIMPIFDGAEKVFHLAAESRIQPAIENPSRAISINVNGTGNVLEACRKHKISKLVYSSTSAVYGLTESFPTLENVEIDCLNPYSTTKYCGEELCRVYNKLYGIDCTIFRYFNVYGDRSPIKGQYAPVVGIFLNQRKNGVPLTVVGTGKQRRDFVHVSDVVSANILASNSTGYGLFNIGFGQNYSILELAQTISSDIKFLPKRPGEANHTFAGIQRVKDVLHWKPKIDVLDWIRSQIS